DVFFDVYLTGAARPEARAELVRQVEARFRVDRVELAAFISAGQRIRVRRGIDQDGAIKAIAELQSLGALVEIEPNRPPADAHEAADSRPTPPASAARPLRPLALWLLAGAALAAGLYWLMSERSERSTIDSEIVARRAMVMAKP